MAVKRYKMDLVHLSKKSFANCTTVYFLIQAANHGYAHVEKNLIEK